KAASISSTRAIFPIACAEYCGARLTSANRGSALSIGTNFHANVWAGMPAPQPNTGVQATANSLVSLLEVTWGTPRHSVPGRERPVEPWSAETGASRGSSRPGLPEPRQVCGAMEPVSARSGGQECGGVTCQVVEGLLWPQPSGTWLYAPLESDGPCRM